MQSIRNVKINYFGKVRFNRNVVERGIFQIIQYESTAILNGPVMRTGFYV
jgi:hypothetical protein